MKQFVNEMVKNDKDNFENTACVSYGEVSDIHPDYKTRAAQNWKCVLPKV